MWPYLWNDFVFSLVERLADCCSKKKTIDIYFQHCVVFDNICIIPLEVHSLACMYYYIVVQLLSVWSILTKIATFCMHIQYTYIYTYILYIIQYTSHFKSHTYMHTIYLSFLLFIYWSSCLYWSKGNILHISMQSFNIYLYIICHIQYITSHLLNVCCVLLLWLQFIYKGKFV